MEKPFWNENFEWIEQEPLTAEEIKALPIQEQVQRELKLAKILSAYKGRWVMRKNQDVIASGGTLAELLDGREERANTAEAVFRVPEDNTPSFYFADAA